MLASCPSGLVAEVRGLRGAEVNLFSDENAVRKGDLFDRILRACVVSVQDPGPYSTHGDSLNWSQVLTCDREYLLVCIRIATYGPDYSVALTCPNVMCKEKFHWDVDLRELEIVDLDDDVIAKIASGKNSFDVVIEGTTFTFKMMIGESELLAARLLRKNRSEILTTAIAVRVIAIDGEAKTQKQIAAYFAKYDKPLSDVTDAIVEYDGGIDNDIEAECPECGGRFDLKLPLEGKAFWLRQKARSSMKSGKKRRTLGA